MTVLLGDDVAPDPAAEWPNADARLVAKRIALVQVMMLMRAHELTPADLGISLKTKKVPKVAKKVKAKYRDPATGSTWAGRGLKPRWMTAALQAGHAIRDFAL